MIDLRPTIIAKSDQLNADDLMAGPMTITITDVRLLDAADQPVAVHWEGGEGRPFKPCKSMRRVMAKVWGEDGKAFIGQKMTVYRDDRVRFGADAVGGIRISHMSGIDRETTMSLMVTRGKRAPYTVKPLRLEGGAPNRTVNLPSLLAKGRAAAVNGSADLAAWWSSLSGAEKAAAKPTLDNELKAAASTADAAAFNDSDTDFPGDAPPKAGEGEGAAPVEAEESDDTGAATDLETWADDLIAALPFMAPEEVEGLEKDRSSVAKFKLLEVQNLDRAKALETAINAAKGG